MSKLFERVIALILVLILTSANMFILGEYTIASALSDEELNAQTSETNHNNVEFNSYFYGGTHNQMLDIGSEDAKIYVQIKVNNVGYLENGVIEFQNTNFKLKDGITNDNIQSIENNQIKLKRINNGSDITLELPIDILRDDNVSLDYFNKETTTKFTGTYVDDEGKKNSVEKEVINKLSWRGTADAELTAEATKYVPYATNGEYGVMVQVKVNSSIKDNALPIKDTNIELTMPTINNIKPTSVNVISTKTEATNGKTDGFDFTNSNYSYDVEQNVVSINTSNSKNNISWRTGATDEYLVIYLFEGKEIYDYAVANGINSSVDVKAELTVYNGVEETVDSNTTAKIEFTEREGTVADFAILSSENISKGFAYANYDTDDKVETEYYTKYIATVNSAKLTTSIQFTQEYDRFLTEDDNEFPTTVGNTNYAYNKKIKVEQDIFNKILGEDGEITVEAEDGTELGKINKNSTLENGNYVLDISDKDNNKVVIKTTAPIAEGQLEVNIEKALKGNMGYSKEQLKTFTKMRVDLEGKTNTTTFTAWRQFLLKEPETKVELSINKEDLTTVLPNENVEIRAVLNTSSEFNALFSNPTLKITLPSYIEEVTIRSTNILLANGLKVKSTKVTEENGHKVINIALQGTQTEYAIDAEYKGAIVVLNTDLTTDTLTPSGKDKITMKYTNNNDVATKPEGTVETEVNFVAPSGIVAANGISDYKDGAEPILSISDEAKTVEIDTYSDKRTAKMNGTIINNYSNSISNVVVLGRIPAQGNKVIDTNNDMGSTFTTPLSTQIGISGVSNSNYKVYYSDNINATRDLKDSNNGWVEDGTTNSKSFMIVFNSSYEMASGEKIDFTYDIELPANLAPNNSTFGMYKVYYTNNADIGQVEESKTSAIIGLTTGQGPELEVKLSSTANTVREGQYIKMKVDVKNTGKVDAEGVKVNIEPPEYITLMEYGVGNGFFEIEEEKQTIDLGTIKAGETKSTIYYVKIDNDTTMVDPSVSEGMTEEEYFDYAEQKAQFPKEIINTVSASVDGISGEIVSNECKFEVQDGQISIYMYTNASETQVMKPGEEMEAIIPIRNISGTGDLTNTIVTLKLPNGIKYVSGTINDGIASEGENSDGITYDEGTNTVTANIGTLDIQKYITLQLEVTEVQANVSMMAEARADNVDTHYSNIIEYNIENANLEISELTSSPRYIKESQNVEYKFSITNVGESIVKNVNIVDVLPQELTYVESRYIYNGEEVVDNNLRNGRVDFNIARIDPGETIEITIVARAGLLPDRNDKEVQNKVQISATGFDAIETNTVTNIIEYYEDAHTGEEEGEDPTRPSNRYRITGTAWVDENMDGKRDASEQTLSGIQVILLNKNATSIIRDPDTNESKITTTGSNGSYEFDNLPNGEYLVIFVYDSSNYSLTEYQKDGVSESFNSDAIDINITLDGKRRIAAITDVITINGANARDIDIGLYTANKFDLKLDKYVDKITLTTPTIGTAEYNYNSDVAKFEVLSRNFGRSSAVIEYKMVITNEGSVPGYVNKIVDYLPEEVSFNTELNADWYLSDNGNIYNASLANEKINPGETKEVTLIVSMKVTEDLIGTFSNTAEIYESYNEFGLQDIDSTAGNGINAEDDMSTADVVVAVVTGNAVIIYTIVALVVIALIGFGIYEIRKHVLIKKN